MRAAILLTAGLLLLPLSLPQAAAASGCGGFWVGSATCALDCDAPTIVLKAHADNPGGIASVRVSVECGFVDPATGRYVGIFRSGCYHSAPDTVAVSCTVQVVGYPLPLIGKCMVSGQVKGAYSCQSA